MKKNDFKTILKPLIKECIKELMFEKDGPLSHIISEVVSGLGSPRQVLQERNIVESRKPSLERLSVDPNNAGRKVMSEFAKNKNVVSETKLAPIEKLKQGFKIGGINIFEGTEPLKEDKQILQEVNEQRSQETSELVDVLTEQMSSKWSQIVKGGERMQRAMPMVERYRPPAPVQQQTQARQQKQNFVLDKRKVSAAASNVVEELSFEDLMSQKQERLKEIEMTDADKAARVTVSEK